MKSKGTQFAALFILALGLMSFSVLKEMPVNVKKSSITWKGYKVTGDHEGKITLDSGVLIFDGQTLTGGKFTMDMSSISTTDLEGESAGKLDGHLKSADFFGVEKHPTAKFEITKAVASGNTYKVTGDLTIKNITNPISFDMTVSGNTAVAQLKIDRAKYNVKYGSGSFFDDLGDRTIYDEFDLNVKLVF